MIDLTLPAKIPGLIRRGSPVIATHRTYCCIPKGTRGVARGLSRPRVYSVAWDAQAKALHPEYADTYSPAQQWTLGLDLTDETGRAHATWWLEERVYSGRFVPGERQALAFEDLADEVHRSGPDGIIDDIEYGFRAWRLGDTWFCGSDDGPEYGTEISVLGDLDPLDARTIDDGSRWVDAESLRLICQYVAYGGVPEARGKARQVRSA